MRDFSNTFKKACTPQPRELYCHSMIDGKKHIIKSKNVSNGISDVRHTLFERIGGACSSNNVQQAQIEELKDEIKQLKENK